MKLTCENYDHVSVFAIRGDLTADDVDTLRSAAQKRLDEDVRDFVLDLAQLEFIDSQGLETLLWLQETCGEKLGQMRLVSLQQHIEKILEITRLAARFDRHDSVDSALKSLR